MRFSQPESEELSLNLAPLIDVVFLLLIFFMVTTSFKRDEAIDLTLPSVQVAPMTSDTLSITINVNRNDEIFFASHSGPKSSFVAADKTRTLSEVIANEIVKLRLEQPAPAGVPPTIVIKADKAASHGKIIQLLDAIAKQGIDKIQFAVEPKMPGL